MRRRVGQRARRAANGPRRARPGAIRISRASTPTRTRTTPRSSVLLSWPANASVRLRREGDGGAAQGAAAGRGPAGVEHRRHGRERHRRRSAALVRALRRGERAAVAGDRSRRRSGPAPDARRHESVRRRGRRRGSGRGPADSYTDRSIYDRCISRGVPDSMRPIIYGASYDITQAPGYVVIRYEMVHEARVIPLDGRPEAVAGDPAIHGRFARVVGRRHARGRDHEHPRRHATIAARRPA